MKTALLLFCTLIILNLHAMYRMATVSRISMQQSTPIRSFKSESHHMLWNARYLDTCERKSTFEQMKILERLASYEVFVKKEYYSLRQGQGERLKFSIVIHGDHPRIVAEATVNRDDESHYPTIEEIHDRSNGRFTPLNTDLLFYAMLHAIGELQGANRNKYTDVMMREWYFADKTHPGSLAEKLQQKAIKVHHDEYFGTEYRIPVILDKE